MMTRSECSEKETEDGGAEMAMLSRGSDDTNGGWWWRARCLANDVSGIVTKTEAAPSLAPA